ncbi:MAG: MerR family transcriptional regulator, partial [Byssovorax sp.]
MAEPVDSAPQPLSLRMAELSARSGVPRETIHFYLREGLLPRPRKGGRTVAYYGEEHLERLRIIRRLREEKYLPLAVIRRLLDAPAAAADRDVDVLAEVLHILPRDDDAVPLPSPAAAREAAARGLLGQRSPPGAPGSDPA